MREGKAIGLYLGDEIKGKLDYIIKDETKKTGFKVSLTSVIKGMIIRRYNELKEMK